MKIKFLEDYKTYCRGMQYPIEQVGKELAEQLEKDDIARIYPLVEPVAETVIEPVKEKQVKKGRK